jgi:hypothetical protein
VTRGTVYLHIGEPKCGTTFLQDVLFQHRDALAAHGVTLPGVDINDHYRAAQDIRDIPQDDDDPGMKWAGSWDLIAREAKATKTISVISHELIVGADDAQAARAIESLAPADVHVVLTVRDLVGLLPAEWQETVKHKNVRTWQEWLADIIDTPPRRRRPRAKWYWSAHDTVRVVKRWSALVGADHVHLVTVPPSSAPRDLLWRRFAQAIGVPDLEIELAETKSNASLGVAEVEMLRRLNERLLDVPLWFYARNVKSNLAHGLLAERGKGKKLGIPQDRHEWVRQQSMRRIRQLGTSGIDIIGDLSELAAPKVFPAGVQPEDLTDAELLDVALDTFGTTIERRYSRASQSPRLRKLMTDTAPDILRARPFARWRRPAWRLAQAVRRHRA